MATIVAVIATLGLTSSLAWVVHAASLIRYRRRVTWLADLPDTLSPGGDWPSLAVALAARDEAESVGAAVRSLLAQDVPGLEVIAVDDRSTDGTGAILDALALGDPRLRVVHVQDLPPDWLGKTHALQRAAEATAADWILFTDADVIFAPGALRRALAFVAAGDADHVVVAPEVPTEGIGERLFLALFGLAFSMKSAAWRVEDPARRAYVGIGAFNLVRADAFRAVGGFRRLALSIDDDLRLGQALKYAGYRTRVLVGAGAVSVRWQVGLVGMIRGVEKNFFAALDFRPSLALLGALGLLWLGAAPHLGLFVGPTWSRLACGAGVGAMAMVLGLIAPISRIGWWYALIMPLAAVLCVVALARSTWFTLRRRGVRWRNHLYPLRDLRTHVRRRNAWLREVWRSTH